jgi:imidazolonepropionase
MNLLLTNVHYVSLCAGAQGYAVSAPSFIVIRNGIIDRISPQSEFNMDVSQFDTTLDCQGKLVTPGFIDSHTHLIFAGSRAQEFEQRLLGDSYQSIILNGGGIHSTVRATRHASEQQLIDLALPRLDSLIRSGCTTVEIKSGYGLTFDDELKMLRAAKALESHRKVNVHTTLLAAHTVPQEYQQRADDYVEWICQEMIPYCAAHQLADSVDVFCESIGFNLQQTERVFKCAAEHGLSIKGHTEQLSNMGGSALAASYGALSVDHIEYLDQAGVEALAKANTVATLLPGAFYFLKETRKPPVELLRRHNVPMAIATDVNPGTSPFADLRLMMNMACTLFGLSPQEALRGVTSHAAQALGKQNTIGQLREGYCADLAVWDMSHPSELSYQLGLNSLHCRIVSGRLDYV